MRSLLIVILICLALPSRAAALLPGDAAAQDVWLLENGPARTWEPALRRLMAQQYLSRLAVASVLRRMDVLQGEDRVKLCRSLGTVLGRDPRASEALLKLTRDPSEVVRREARAALSKRPQALSLEGLLALAAQDGEERIRFIRGWAERYSEIMALESSPRKAALMAKAGARGDDAAYGIFSRLAQSSDQKIADAAAGALGVLVDARVEDRLLERAMAGSHTAMLQLAKRGDARALDPIVEWGLASASRARDDFDRRRALQAVGHSLPGLFFPRLVEYYRAAADAPQKHQARLMIEGHVGLGLLDEPVAMREIRSLAKDPDEFLRETALKVLDWERKRENARAAPEQARRAWLVAAALAGILVGAAMYLLGFRLLVLKRFVRGIPAARIRSVPVGLVALQGEVRPYRDGKTTHPLTGEECVVCERTRLPFMLDDGTGQILVDPRGAALLSEDGVLAPGEKVLVVGTLRQGVPQTGGTPQRFIARRDQELTWFARISGWLARALTGLLLGRGAARMMFLNERQCFWIWDDLDQRPFLGERESATMTAGLLFAGAWVLVFVGAVLGLPSL